MRLTRCFVASALREHAEIDLPTGAAAHVARVLRARAGDALTLFDGSGGEYAAQILAVNRDTVRVRVGVHNAVERESPLHVTLLQAVARGERMDLIVQKATELGVVRIVPLLSERSLVRVDADGAQRKHAHWQQIAIGACEQCGRNRVPQIDVPLDLPQLCATLGEPAAPERRLLLTPGAAAGMHVLLNADVRSVRLLIGPEGGFADAELHQARVAGFTACSLGPRVLRAETAPLAALAVVQALAGDLATA